MEFEKMMGSGFLKANFLNWIGSATRRIFFKGRKIFNRKEAITSWCSFVIW